MTYRHIVRLCYDCALVVANADTSHLSDEREAIVIEGLERIGPMSLGLPVDAWVASDLYNKCSCCRGPIFGAESFYAYPAGGG